MKIVILDGYTLNPGDLSWDSLLKFGEVVIYDRTPSDQIKERAKGFDVVITNKTPLIRETINSLPELKYIGVLATGYNVVDCNAAKEKGIIVTNIPTYGTTAVSQFAFALILELCHHVQEHSDAVKRGDWSNCQDFCFWNYPLIELAGKTIGIIGFGRIGQQTADIAAALGMNILAYDKFSSDQSHRINFKWTNMDELLLNADVVSLHCPLFPETEGIINKENLKKMKKTAFLVNTSRGPLVVDKDLADALNEGIIAGAAVDVLSVEPPSMENPLMKAKNCIITPHIAWATGDARSRLLNTAVENVKAFIDGNPQNVVNK
jgi:glycerate dehydrogenase